MKSPNNCTEGVQTVNNSLIIFVNRGTEVVVTTFGVYPCHVDGEPCEVVARFHDALVREVGKALPQEEVASCYRTALGAVGDCLPCSYCRGVEDTYPVNQLPRLGWRERRILLQAPPPDGEAVIIAPEAPGRAADEAHRRAIRRLFSARLIDLRGEGVKIRMKTYRLDGWPVLRRYWKLAVRRSLLGQAIVERLQHQLEARVPIRWSTHRSALLSACRRDTSELLTMFQANVAKKVEDWQRALSGGSRLGVRDNSLLQSYTRACMVLHALRGSGSVASGTAGENTDG